MIRANELRIGNILRIKTSSTGFHLIKIKGVTDFGIINPEKNKMSADCTIEDLEPIPLTPEILGQCGFEICNPLNVENPNTYFKKGMGEFLTYQYDGLCIYEGTKVVIKYLHQLQNLYFALTGEELKVNFNVAANQ